MSGGMQGGGGVPETLLDTKGQIHGYSTENVAVSVGSNDQIVYADSSATPGIVYGASTKSTLDATGKMVYASAANTLAAITPGSENDVMTLGAASVPGWATPAGGGGSMEYHETHTLGSSVGSFTWTFGTGITLADVSKVVVVCSFRKSSTASTIFLKYNGVGTSTYNNAVFVMNSSGTTGGYYNSARFYGWDLFEVNNTYSVAGTCEIFKNTNSGKMHMTKTLSGEGGACFGSGYNTGTGAAMPATLSSLYFEANTGNIESGSKFDLYTVNR